MATILARPLFSTTRRPPPAQRRPGGRHSTFDDTRLAGIVTEPGHRFAIFAPAGAKPLIVSEGDTVSGWRVDSITAREVSLSGPGGTKTLQPKIDPNLAPPAASADGCGNASRRSADQPGAVRRCGLDFRRRCSTGRRCGRVSCGSGDEAALARGAALLCDGAWR